ncbi:MAG: chromosomal replication initiator protein DnaA, partial [Xanthomonadales bacterium]|nr:chromosomal replication initiator protein DnaA [Xanthomonadales bacterium]
MPQNIWQRCLQHLERELPPEDINTWIRPLQAISGKSRTRLLAPNAYVRDHISENYLERIRDIFEHLGEARDSAVIEVGQAGKSAAIEIPARALRPVAESGLDTRYRFDNFVRGKSNELGLAATQQVAQKPGGAYN